MIDCHFLSGLNSMEIKSLRCSQDFFYVCLAHLQDRHFCSPIIDTEGQAKRLKDDAMAEEIEKVKKEYEEKQRRKKERKASSKDEDEKDKDKDDTNDKGKDTPESSKNDEKERDEKVGHSILFIISHMEDWLTRQIASIQKKNGTETKPDDSPRVFSLHKYVLAHACEYFYLTTEQELLSNAHRPATQHRDGETKPGKDEEPFTFSFCANRKAVETSVSFPCRSCLHISSVSTQLADSVPVWVLRKLASKSES